MSPKQTILQRYRNEINTVNKLKLNYFTNIHLFRLRFINILCVITMNYIWINCFMCVNNGKRSHIRTKII